MHFMQRFLSSAVIILFFIWILPLGAFFKPSQAKIACDGQRAICLCPHLIAKHKAKDQGEKIVIVNPGVQKEGSSSGGASHDFVFIRSQHHNNCLASFLLHQNQSIQQLLFNKEVEHVPKA